MKKLLTFSAVVLAFSTAPVLAGNSDEAKKGHGSGGMFEKHDLNGDGVISKDEFLKQAENRFSQMDKNGDGSISKDEAQSAHKSMREKMKEHREMRKEKRAEKADSSDE